MRAADVLEFESLRKLLGRYVSSPQGFRELEKLAPHVDRERLTEDLAEAAEAVAYLRLALRPQPAARGAAIRVDFGGLPDTQAAVQKLRIEGASLDPKEIYDLFALLDRAADAKSVCSRPPRSVFRASAGAPKPSAISAAC
jgi:DNA mismatch repair protein MutS2